MGDGHELLELAEFQVLRRCFERTPVQAHHRQRCVCILTSQFEKLVHGAQVHRMNGFFTGWRYVGHGVDER